MTGGSNCQNSWFVSKFMAKLSTCIAMYQNPLCKYPVQYCVKNIQELLPTLPKCDLLLTHDSIPFHNENIETNVMGSLFVAVWYGQLKNGWHFKGNMAPSMVFNGNCC